MILHLHFGYMELRCKVLETFSAEFGNGEGTRWGRVTDITPWDIFSCCISPIMHRPRGVPNSMHYEKINCTSKSRSTSGLHKIVRWENPRLIKTNRALLRVAGYQRLYRTAIRWTHDWSSLNFLVLKQAFPASMEAVSIIFICANILANSRRAQAEAVSVPEQGTGVAVEVWAVSESLKHKIIMNQVLYSFPDCCHGGVYVSCVRWRAFGVLAMDMEPTVEHQIQTQYRLCAAAVIRLSSADPPAPRNHRMEINEVFGV
ncbi:hypothetical protein B0H13DRAFT_1894881 [Mycena leptocephala]|nr:hypothetical protein B0H13DRAFT_1894881 [Mycena leptocephala]